MKKQYIAFLKSEHMNNEIIKYKRILRIKLLGVEKTARDCSHLFLTCSPTYPRPVTQIC